jgi:hypothetical protein
MTTHQRRKKRNKNHLSLDGSSHQTGDAAFTPATPHASQHSRANTDSHNSHNTQYSRAKSNALCFMQKGTQPSQACSGGHITPNPIQIDAGDATLLMGSIHYTRLEMPQAFETPRAYQNGAPAASLVSCSTSFNLCDLCVVKSRHHGYHHFASTSCCCKFHDGTIERSHGDLKMALLKFPFASP